MNVFEKLLHWLYSQHQKPVLSLSVRTIYPYPKQQRGLSASKRLGKRFLSLRLRSNRRKAR
jgi:hypothetical protein